MSVRVMHRGLIADFRFLEMVVACKIFPTLTCNMSSRGASLEILSDHYHFNVKVVLYGCFNVKAILYRCCASALSSL
jgi:hypothetical protein